MSPHHLFRRRAGASLSLCIVVVVVVLQMTSSTFAVTASSEARAICQARFARFARDHTACVSPSPTCRILERGLESGAQQLILDVHNQYRAYIAAGNESRLGFPGASNMLKLEWDPELAYVAQAHADQCKFEHDCYDCRRTGKYKVVGQNLYVYQTSRTGSAVRQQWRSIIKEWYDEIRIAPPSVARSFNLHDLNIGHFTQMAWASTNRVGCGAVTYDITGEPSESGGPSPFKTAVLYTCNYAPGGNYLGEKMYRNGAAASSCPKKHRPSSKFPTLCELSSSVTTTSSSSSNESTSTTRVTSQVTTSGGGGQANYNQVTNIVRKKVITTRRKTKKIKKINKIATSTGTVRITSTTTTTATQLPKAARPQILLNIATSSTPSLFDWNISTPTTTVVQPPIIVPTAKPVAASAVTIPIQVTEPQIQPTSRPLVDSPTSPTSSAPSPVSRITTTTSTTTTTTSTRAQPTPAPALTTPLSTTIRQPSSISTRTPSTIRPLNSGGAQLVAAVAPWWRKWIVNSQPLTPSIITPKPLASSNIAPAAIKPSQLRTRHLVTSSINRKPSYNSINKWPTSSLSITNKSNTGGWGSLIASSSNQVPRLANAHWSSHNVYFLTQNNNNITPRPQSLVGNNLRPTTFNNLHSTRFAFSNRS